MTRLFLLPVALLFLAGCVTETTGPKRQAPDPEKQLQAHIELGVGYITNGEYARAKENLTRALELDPENPQAHNAFGLLFEIEGESDLAERHFRRALAADRSFTRARNNYGAFLFAQGRYEDAIEQLSQAAEDRFYPNRAQVFENLGVAYLRLGRREEAEPALLRATQLNPGQSRALLEMADLRFRDRNYVEAQDYYRRHIRVSGQSARSLFLCVRLAQVFSRQDEEASCRLMLRNVFPASDEYKRLERSLSR